VLSAVALLASLLAAVAILMHPDDASRTAYISASVIGSVCVPAGLSLMLLCRSVPRSRRLSLLLFGVVLLGYGAGQLLNAVQSHQGTRVLPSPGDVLAATATPLLLVAFAVAPVVSRSALPVTRLLVDGAMLGTFASLCLWVLAVPAQDQTGSGWPLLLTVVVGVGLAVTLPLTAALRDGGTALLVVALTVVLFSSVDVLVVVDEVATDVPARLLVAGFALQACLPVPMALAARAWALQAARPPDPLAKDTGTRTTVVTSTVAAALTVAVLLGSRGQVTGTAAIGLCLTAVALVGAREVLLATTQRSLLDRLTRQVMRDPLTGLHSALALRQGTSVEVSGVVVVDIMGLDSVNQVHGREVGDRLVHAVGAAVSAAAPAGASCYRAGGDELAVVLPAGSVSDVLAVAAAVQGQVTRQVRIGCTDHGPRLAVGVARAEGGVAPLATVLEDAVDSMHVAQRRRSPTPVLHDSTQTAVRQRRTALEQRLPAAVAAGRITVLAQPLVDLGTGIVVGVEALARWHDEVLGTVSPVEFVEVAEHSGIIDALGEHVLRTAASEAARTGLLDRGMRLSVNVSPIQLRSARFVGLVEEVIAEHRIAHRQLTLEVTESVVLDEDGPAVEHLHALVRLGAGIAIDDFGAGHASLGYLRRIPAHVLKLDRSLVVAAGSDPRARAVLQASLELCAGLGMLSVVEGVETSDVSRDMTELGADLGQGWLWSPAVPFEQVMAQLDRAARTAEAAALL